MEHLAASTSDCVDTGLDGGTRDYTNEFKTTKKFGSKEELITWAREVGRSHGFVIITLRSDSGKGSKRPRVTLGCERSGKSDSRSDYKESLELKVRNGGRVGTKKCDCPFRLMGKKLEDGDEWEVIVPEGKGTHNHEVGVTVEQGHSYRGRLSKEEKSLLKDMWKAGEKPKGILRALKERNRHNKSTSRTIYNESQSLERRKILEDTSSKLLQLMSKASEYNYIEKHRANPKNEKVLDFFFTYPPSLELLLLFPMVLIIDYNFSVHSYMGGMWTVEIYGVTSTHIKFSVAGAIFSKSTIESSYRWALNSFRGVMVDKGIDMPDIVIFWPDNWTTYVSHTCVEATNDVFPTAKLLLSTTYRERCGIYEDVGRKSKNMNLDSFERMWKLLEASPRTPTEALEGHLMQLRREFDKYPEAVEYVIDNWFMPYKEMCIPAWTDELMHFGNTDPERMYWFDFHWFVYISACAGVVVVQQTVIDTFWEDMRSDNENMLIKIEKSFQESLENEYKNEDGLSELKELHGSVSNYALELIKNQTNKIVDGDHSDSCSCAIKRTHGLPCAHEIAEYKREGRPIPLECINSHWKKLPLELFRGEESEEMNTGTDESEEMDTDTEESEEMNTDAHNFALSKPNIVESESNSLYVDPSIVPSTEEAQPEHKVHDIPPAKQLEFSDVCPSLLRPYIREIMDVPRDGHCGFRAIASLMGYSEKIGWMEVRESLKVDLTHYQAYYAQLFGSDHRVNELIHVLEYSHSIRPEKEHWMSMPDMGHIIASCYNVILVHLSSRPDQCSTFFPLRTPPPTSVSISPPKEIVIGFGQEHFVRVYWEEDVLPVIPMPPPARLPAKKNPHEKTEWEKRSTEWATLYHYRIAHFKCLHPVAVSEKNTIVIEIESEHNMDSLFELRL